ncbi:hypothetical protein ACQJBY_066662 [Aegilops geniculata]
MRSQALGARADGQREDLDSVAAPTGSTGSSLSLALSASIPILPLLVVPCTSCRTTGYGGECPPSMTSIEHP